MTDQSELYRLLMLAHESRNRKKPLEDIPGVFPVYNSISEFLAALPSREMWGWNSEMVGRSKWAGGRTFEDAKDYYRRGADEDELRAARDLIDQIDIHIHGVKGDVWKPQVHGAYPIVPDYLAGDPFSMRWKELDEQVLAPMKIILDTGVSCDVSSTTLARRAAAVTAFAMKLSERRPVEVWIAHPLNHSTRNMDIAWMTKMDAPVNISQVMAAYNPSVCRKLDLNMAEHLSGSNGAYSGEHYPLSIKGMDVHYNRAGYAKAFREVFHVGPDDLILGPAGSFDMDDIDANPVEWVRTMLMQYGFEAEDQV